MRFAFVWLGIPFYFVIMVFVFVIHRPWARRFGMMFYRWVYKVVGIHVCVEGAPSMRTTVFVANHISYMDILVLGSLIKAGFIAKKEVKRWPIIGSAARMMGTLFISRHRNTLMKELKELTKRLTRGEKFILFPEGTCGDGVKIFPFKSTFFHILMPKGCDMWVQPVSLKLTKLNGLPMADCFKKRYSWRGDQTLVANLWGLCRMGCVHITVSFGPALKSSDFSSRQDMAHLLWHHVAGLDKPQDTLASAKKEASAHQQAS
ncbi:lysophospholipid acyltransferase family protein [Candidatus Hepatobacter penaei]|uniref:lysophospholipid acyltransferase family protein n=1 Tax=Candidatus Hepatobacter penaei TaxID=1274402 RepID=UPI001442068F|nr:lysophospholipid acyltransferase family protein [Candidatus Hepatobacter penaei]